jgi:hypothetical protein
MKRFEQLHADDQLQLLIATIETIATTECNTIEELAEARSVTALDIWQEICAEAGLDECTPWKGFPATPTDLPDAPGGNRELELPESAKHFFERMRPPKTN